MRRCVGHPPPFFQPEFLDQSTRLFRPYLGEHTTIQTVSYHWCQFLPLLLLSFLLSVYYSPQASEVLYLYILMGRSTYSSGEQHSRRVHLQPLWLKHMLNILPLQYLFCCHLTKSRSKLPPTKNKIFLDRSFFSKQIFRTKILLKKDDLIFILVQFSSLFSIKFTQDVN